MDWIAATAEWVRHAVAGQQALAALAPFVTAAPDWAVAFAGPFVLVFIVLWTVGSARKTAADTADTLHKGAAGLGLVKDKPKPANVDQVEALKEQLAEMSARDEQRYQALLSIIQTGREDAVVAQAQKSAVAGLIADASPESAEAEKDFLAGDDQAAYAALEREARAAAEDAAEKWRRLGALAYGKDTARALAAYEKAHAAQPEDFWTLVFLARLYRQAGKLMQAKEMAERSRRAVKSARDESVAEDELGDVLVKTGDLSGAKQRFEASLAVRDRLAAANPGSAEAQRDLIVSYAKLAGVFPGQGWWRKAHETAQKLAAEGRLAPADEWILDHCAKHAAEDE
ncbi:MAG TPA: tetratricopeptide repeat protein [Caulobacterales bacterium]|nr:tetratricopeptide repeat protein [Caulobacterales bacterium]